MAWVVALEATWWEGYQVCPLKDSSLPHRMGPTLAPVRQGQATRMEKTLVAEGLRLGRSSSSSSNNSLT